MTTFYVKFDDGNTTLNFKLLDKDKSPKRMYRIQLTKERNYLSRSAIFINEQGYRFFFLPSKDTRRMSEDFINVKVPDRRSYIGFWIRYSIYGFQSGTIALGKVSDSQTLITWQDSSQLALRDVRYVGFEVESGKGVHISADCYQ